MILHLSKLAVTIQKDVLQKHKTLIKMCPFSNTFNFYGRNELYKNRIINSNRKKNPSTTADKILKLSLFSYLN